MRILVTGSREWTREDLVRGAIQDWLTERYGVGIPWTELVIVHGACPTGADLHAARWAFDFDVRQETYPANWAMYGKRAGPFRNQQMADAGADVCLAFPLGASRGTRDCMRRAQEAGIPVKSFELGAAKDDRFNFNPAKPPGEQYTWKELDHIGEDGLSVEDPEKMIIDDIHHRTRKLINDLTKEGS